MDITKQLEKILNERPIKLSDIQDAQLPDNDKALNELQKLCDKKLAYRFGVDEFVGRQFLWNLILDAIKSGDSLTTLTLSRQNYFISQHIISKMLECMESDGLIQRENNAWRIVLDKVLSRDVILEFCHQRADQITVENILIHFHFAATVKAHGRQGETLAYNHCKQIIDKLCGEGILVKSRFDESFSWKDI